MIIVDKLLKIKEDCRHLKVCYVANQPMEKTGSPERERERERETGTGSKRYPSHGETKTS